MLCFFFFLIGEEKKRPSRRRKQKAKQDMDFAAGLFQDATMWCVKRQKRFLGILVGVKKKKDVTL